MASNCSSKGCGGANPAVQLEGLHIEQSTLNQSSIGENDLDLLDASFDQTNPQAKCFRKKGCDHFNILGLIFGKSIATSILARASTQIPPNSDEEIELEEECMHGKKKSYVNLDDDLEGPLDPPPKKNAGTSSRKKESKSSKMDNAIDAWIAFSIVRLEKYKRSGHNDLVDEPYSIEICMDVLEAMEDVDSQQYFRACAKFKDRDWRQMFLKMSALRRKEWLDILD